MKAAALTVRDKKHASATPCRHGFLTLLASGIMCTTRKYLLTSLRGLLLLSGGDQLSVAAGSREFTNGQPLIVDRAKSRLQRMTSPVGLFLLLDCFRLYDDAYSHMHALLQYKPTLSASVL